MIQAQPLQTVLTMTEQQRQPRRTRETSQLQTITGDDVRRKALDDRNAAVRRWIDDDDDACCRGID